MTYNKQSLLFLKRFSGDFALSLVATLVSTGTLQLLLYPRLAVELGADGYGVMLTIMGILSIVTSSFGSNLGYTRLIREHDYKANGIAGDFQLLLGFAVVISGAISMSVCFVFHVAVVDGLGIVLLAVTTVLQSYYIVAFRLTIDYLKNLIANIALCIGYVIGSLFLLQFLPWAWTFVLANILSIMYIAFASDIVYESWKRTPLFVSSAKSYAHLAVGGLLSNAINYLDRFIVYPLLGAASVSAYSVASYFSKGLSLAFSPLTGVLITYFTQGRVKASRRIFLGLNAILVVGVFVYVVVCVTAGTVITNFLYPTIYNDASSYILLASFGTAISLSASFNAAFVMSFSSPIWQSILPGVSFVSYCALAIPLTAQFDLYGICIAAIASSSLRFLSNAAVGWASISSAR